MAGPGVFLPDGADEDHEPAGQSDLALGEKFDLRKFHDAVLDQGPLPLGLLEKKINDWIAGQQ